MPETEIQKVENTPAAWDERAKAETAYEAACWSPHGQRARFDRVLHHLRLQPGETVLDFGCGAGALYEHLPRSIVYCAHDWSPAMLERVKRQRERAVVLTREALHGKRFDHVVAVGPFNLPDNWSKDETWQEVARLWDHSWSTLVVSLYRGEDERCIRYSPVEVAAFAMELPSAPRFQVDCDYLDNDLMLVVRR